MSHHHALLRALRFSRFDKFESVHLLQLTFPRHGPNVGGGCCSAGDRRAVPLHCIRGLDYHDNGVSGVKTAEVLSLVHPSPVKAALNAYGRRLVCVKGMTASNP